jgi:hypothetical protein
VSTSGRMRISESDWKAFKQVRLLALERFSQRVLDDCQRICRDESLSAHERYRALYALLEDRDRDMSAAFDDFRRSTAGLCLKLMRRQGVVTDEEMLEFSAEVQRVTEFD